MRQRQGIVGGSSFTAKTLIARAGNEHARVFDARKVPTDGDLDGLDCLINCAFNPRMNSEPYDESQDLDVQWARLAAKNDVHFIMLSSRRVYAEEEQFGAREESKTVGIDGYGRNKLETEKRLRGIVPDENLTILRIGNLIGSEYPRNRSSLMGYMLGGLVTKNSIEFTQSPFSRRDCLPFEVAADILWKIMDTRLAGTYNLGAGFATMIGEIALWVIAGYGSGQLCTHVGGAQGEFCLQVDKLQAKVPWHYSREELEAYCVGLGKSLSQDNLVPRYAT